ncbi:MAG: DNA polymerase I [Deltaproteobacteria bacterium]|nr:DNA polymerase I [Deltaproteobacteria bacterium]
MKKEETIYLVDGSSYIYRAYHAIRHLSNSKGLPTNASFGFVRMLLKLLEDRQPSYLAMIFDAKGPTFRHEIYKEYKANRPPMPEDLSVQIPYIKKIVGGFNIPSLELNGYEADDIIGTLAGKATEKGYKTVIVTGDKDFKQILSKSASLWDPMKDRSITYEGFKEELSIEPEQWIDVLGLAGDSSDNIPGVPGIGAKTAVKLVKEFGNIDHLLEHIDQVKQKKIREKLMAHIGQARLSRKLAAIDINVPLPFNFQDFRVVLPDREKLGLLFRDLEFRQLQKDFAPQQDLSKKSYRTIFSDEELRSLIEDLKKAGTFAFDLETTSIDPMEAEIVGLSFSCRPHEAAYIPCAHSYPDAPAQLDLNHVLKPLKSLLEDPNYLKVGQNIKYDTIILKRYGIAVKGIAFDTMIASYLLNPSLRAHNLDAIARDYLNHKMITYKEVTGHGRGALRFDEVPIESASTYSCEDADITLMASRVLGPKLKEKGFESLFSDVEMPLVPVLIDMEMTGIRVDSDRLIELSKDFEQQLHLLEDQIFSMAGESFNISSHQQLGKILFEKLNLPCQKKTKKKTGYSTDLEVLTTLSEQHELPGLVLRYRSLAKLKSTYTDALLGLVHPDTGRIHTSYNQTVTATGRLSSSDPNLQNIPIRTEEGRKIRESFIPRQGWRLLSADYSQIELRILAHYSGDPILIQAFEEDEDIHARTASEVFQLFPEFVTPDMRRQAKVINFGIIYGMSPFRLSKGLGISVGTAKKYIENYFVQYKGVKEYIDHTIDTARKEGKVTTLLNRHRYLPDIRSKNRIAREAAERTAINTPIQGTAADLIKVAMIRLHDAIQSEGLKARMLLQVHDELVFEAPPEEVSRLKDLVKRIMEGVHPLKVPIKVDINAGENWAEAH